MTESERAYWAMISANLAALYRQKTAEAGTRSIEREETSGEVFAELFGGFFKTHKKTIDKIKTVI